MTPKGSHWRLPQGAGVLLQYERYGADNGFDAAIVSAGLRFRSSRSDEVGQILDRQRRTVRFARPGMEVDLGGIAKGFAVEIAAGVLHRTLADALSKAVFVLGPTAGLALVESLSGTSGLVASRDRNGGIALSMSVSLKARFHPADTRRSTLQ